MNNEAIKKTVKRIYSKFTQRKTERKDPRDQYLLPFRYPDPTVWNRKLYQ